MPGSLQKFSSYPGSQEKEERTLSQSKDGGRRVGVGGELEKREAVTKNSEQIRGPV